MAATRRLGVGRALVRGAWVDGDVEVDASGRVVAVACTATARVAGGASERVAVPAFVDLQVNGVGDIDLRYTDQAGYTAVAEQLGSEGVGAYRPTLHSMSVAAYVDALGSFRAYRDTRTGRTGVRDGLLPDGDTGAAHMLDAHLEGPFLNEVWAGAHDRHLLTLPSARVLDRLLEAGPVGMMTIAPELPGAFEVIAPLLSAGITASMGHTDASAQVTRAALDRGVTMITHCFNAHRRFRPRDPGPAGVALTDARCAVGVVCDGVHLAPETVSLVFEAAGRRAVVVTDRVANVGPVSTVDGRAQLADGTIAGGAASMADALRFLRSIGRPLAEAMHALATHPARLAGLGSWDLAPGSGTVALVLDERGDVAAPVGTG